MTCPFLEYRTEADGTRFDEARAYCTAADRFVQPMRADVCNDRYDLEHDADCEIFLEHADAAADDEREVEDERDAEESARSDGGRGDGGGG